MTNTGYVEWTPAADLSPAVACVWIGHVGDPALHFTDRVLPDGCVDLIWDGAGLFVAGPDTGPVMLAPDPPRTYVGVRMAPGRASSLIGRPVSEIRDLRVDLAELWKASRTERLADAMRAATDTPSAALLLEDAVRRQLSSMPPHDRLVDGLVEALERASSAQRITALADDLGVTRRSLHRRCTQAVGFGPKTLDRVLRFRHVQRTARRHPATPPGALAAAAGYADQPHLTRECRRLSGLTPAELFALTTPVVRDGLSHSFNTGG